MKIKYDLSSEEFKNMINISQKCRYERTIGKQKKNKRAKSRLLLFIFTLLLFILSLIIYTVLENNNFIDAIKKASICAVIGFIVIKILIIGLRWGIESNIIKASQKIVEEILIEHKKGISIEIDISDRLIKASTTGITEEIGFKYIEGVEMVENFLVVNYLESESLCIPIKAFSDEEEKEAFIKIIEENKEKYKDEELGEMKTNNIIIEFEYLPQRDDFEIRYEYLITTNLWKEMMKRISVPMYIYQAIVSIVTIIMTTLIIGSIYIIPIITVLIFVIILFINKKRTPKILKKIIIKEFEKTNKKIKVILADDGIIICDGIKNIKTVWIKIDEITDFKGVLIAKSKKAIIFSLPNNVFDNIENRKKVIDIVNEKMRI
ncbi:hypothetical protein J1C67_10465 [Clostridium gasigenes]|uniref:hypothetical protein n=1 Tax=Clostridium gasigenes TaxID=94869 RepID=UPI0014385A59|nr:hypothetical protein [Clostridium gasigenes]NKF07568.1 hypothetical protein [Clostridium gasigenes]QSW18000.1 hypothetical protein J1C67_10465 [Clostridium gasigenes]